MSGGAAHPGPAGGTWPAGGGLPERADVVVVGGGIAGVSVAYHLASSSVSVTLPEERTIGSGTTSAVYANHLDTRRFSPFLADEIVPVRGQAMVAVPARMPELRCATTHWQHNLWRRTIDGRLVIGGWRHDAWGRGYYRTRAEVDPALQDDLVGWFELAFPAAAPLEIVGSWSGIYGWSADQLPLVGPLPGRMGELVAAGFSGGGLAFAFEAGRLIAHVVTGGEPVDGTELFNPRRFT